MKPEKIFKMIEDFDNKGLADVLDDTLDYEARDKSGDTYLHCAARENNPEAFELLLSKGNSKLDELDRDSSSVLRTACGWGAIGIVDLILTKYAFAFDINEGMKRDEKTPFAFLQTKYVKDIAGFDEEKERLLIIMLALGARSNEWSGPRVIAELKKNHGERIQAAKAAYFDAALLLIEQIQPTDALNRFALRKAYYQLAEFEYLRKNLDKAIEYIETCFSIYDLSDDKELFAYDYYALRGHIYKAASEHDGSWLPNYKEVLQTIVDNNIVLGDEAINKDIKKYQIMVDGKFTLSENKNAVRFPNETALNAFDRYRAVIKTKETYELQEVITEDVLKVAEQKLGMSLPETLAKFYLQVGNGLSDGNLAWCQGLSFNTAQWLCGFFDNIQAWCGDKEDYDVVEEDDNARELGGFVNENYKVFATFYENEDCHYKFFFGKNGKMGISIFEQDGMNYDADILNPDMPLLQYEDIDEMVSKFFQFQINQNLAEQNLLSVPKWDSLATLTTID